MSDGGVFLDIEIRSGFAYFGSLVLILRIGRRLVMRMGLIISCTIGVSSAVWVDRRAIRSCGIVTIFGPASLSTLLNS